MTHEVRIVEDPEALADLAAATIARWLRQADPPRTFGIAGGSTPRLTYLRLRREPVPWTEVDAWMSDERWVPPDDENRNGLMARRALFDHVPARFHPVPSTGEPDEAAAGYEATLDGIFAGQAPRVITLGIGEDGHTASLFPGSDALDEQHRRFVARPLGDNWRLTATPPLLWAADQLAFLATGAAKAAMVARVLAGDTGPPAGHVAAGARSVTWFLDRAAAAAL